MGRRGLASFHLSYISVSCATCHGQTCLALGSPMVWACASQQSLTLRLFVKKLVDLKQDQWATTHRCSWGNHLKSSWVGSLHFKYWWVAQKAPLTELLLGQVAKRNGVLGFPFINIRSSRQSGAGIAQDSDLRTVLSFTLPLLLLGNPRYYLSFLALDYRLASAWP